MRQAIWILMALGAVASSHAAIITQWNFNSINPDANTGTGTVTPAIGSGTANLIGGTTATFASGDASGGSSDPATGDDSGWNLTTWPAQGTGSGTAGAYFAVSTVGFSSIAISMDNRHSNTMSKWLQVQYTVDGGSSFSAAGLAGDGLFSATGGDTWHNGRSVDFSGVTGAANNASFGFRVVSVFAPGTGGYVASNPTSTYGTSGTLRFDMVTVRGEAVPEPATMAVLGLGVAAMVRRRRNRR